MSAFGGARGVGAKPPEKGIFPLDHFGECKQVSLFHQGLCQATLTAAAHPPPLLLRRLVDAGCRCVPGLPKNQ